MTVPASFLSIRSNIRAEHMRHAFHKHLPSKRAGWPAYKSKVCLVPINSTSLKKQQSLYNLLFTLLHSLYLWHGHMTTGKNRQGADGCVTAMHGTSKNSQQQRSFFVTFPRTHLDRKMQVLRFTNVLKRVCTDGVNHLRVSIVCKKA